ncbi:ATP-binding protein [Sporosarcina sp. G11-34]|uniref:ATP-binding protein n=1 Tax=Sporosarcina sp. G11-34 TaxID=2849605 RepID=UPI0022A9F476|nr:ATP-binding protein [Sporosarcina sp. G11-34]MCZ2257184.1 hypothetical protein [Sporosarcina sp. G11-34]
MKNEKEEANDREYIRIILADPNNPTVLLNLDGEIYQANDRFFECFGLARFDNVDNLMIEGSSQTWGRHIKLANEVGFSTFTFDTILPTNKTCSIKARLIYSERLGKTIADFTDPVYLEMEQKIRNLNVFRKSTELMIIVDRNGIIQDVNDLTYDFFALPKDYFIGNNYEKVTLLLNVTPSESESYRKNIREKGYVEILRRFEHSPEDIRYYQIRTFLDEESGLIITRVANHTEKVVLRQQLSYKEPLAEIGQLAASIAHEIRNPMTTLKGFTQLLRSSATEESNKYLDVLDDEIGRMESILSEMLVLSKPSTMEKKLLSLDVVVADMITLVQPKARLEGVSFEQNEEVFPQILIYGDETKIKQVLLNLFKNALEAMTSGGVIKIKLEEVDEDQILLRISDTGKGMTTTQLKSIYLPYFTTRQEGTGLGLPFVIKTIEDHGGTIEVSSIVGVGSEFTLTFPMPVSQIKNEVLVERELFNVGLKI